MGKQRLAFGRSSFAPFLSPRRPLPPAPPAGPLTRASPIQGESSVAVLARPMAVAAPTSGMVRLLQPTSVGRFELERRMLDVEITR